MKKRPMAMAPSCTTSEDQGEENKGKKENMKEEGCYTKMLNSPTFKEMGNGRFRCVETGHEMLSKDLESYKKSRKCRVALIDIAISQKKLPFYMFKQDPQCKTKLICKLTEDIVNKSEEHIWKHVNGGKFLLKLEAADGKSSIETEKLHTPTKSRYEHVAPNSPSLRIKSSIAELHSSANIYNLKNAETIEDDESEDSDNEDNDSDEESDDEGMLEAEDESDTEDEPTPRNAKSAKKRPAESSKKPPAPVKKVILLTPQNSGSDGNRSSTRSATPYPSKQKTGRTIAGNSKQQSPKPVGQFARKIFSSNGSPSSQTKTKQRRLEIIEELRQS
ncbi:hypothetical protein IFM89_027042 [Coptis chinensis]|uniref:Uncharacterized protein n=1 Tax=Coptis chinensis TaxID=261450 RepID=A0A835HD98_9MAGN|nr:hypothetical protein IFM89_027042 [Coptis chinensis]